MIYITMKVWIWETEEYKVKGAADEGMRLLLTKRAASDIRMMTSLSVDLDLLKIDENMRSILHIPE